jgi:DNA-directed RNA polymerase subunit omega
MARVTVEDCLEKVDNRFLLVMLAAKRVKQLYKGARPLIENKADNKNVVLALREIAAGKTSYDLIPRKSRKLTGYRAEACELPPFFCLYTLNRAKAKGVRSKFPTSLAFCHSWIYDQVKRHTGKSFRL